MHAEKERVGDLFTFNILFKAAMMRGRWAEYPEVAGRLPPSLGAMRVTERPKCLDKLGHK